MARSVDYLSGADQVVYLTAHDIQDQYDWELFQENITEQLKSLFPSLEDSSGWDGRETNIILENELAEIGISEYMGLVSVSIRAKEYESYYDEYNRQGLAQNWLDRIAPKFATIGELRKVGTFSNGEAIFESKEHTYSSKEGLLEWA